MPQCKNDPKKTYKGTEPSPKGLGYCAHSEKLGKERKGLDGNTWIVSQTKSGVKRWTKLKKENKKIIVKKESKSDYPMMIVYLYIEKDEDNNFFTSNQYIPKNSKELKKLYKTANFKYMDEDIGEFDVKYTLYGVKNIMNIKKIFNSTKKLSYKLSTLHIKNINIYIYENEKDFEDNFFNDEMKEINNKKNKKKGLFGLFF